MMKLEKTKTYHKIDERFSQKISKSLLKRKGKSNFLENL